jgi:predicted metal-binding membrane protein
MHVAPAMTARAILLGRGPVLWWIGFYAAILAAWLALWLIERQASAALAGLPADFWASLCTTAGEARFPALVAMWALMASAMMLPTFVPALRVYRQLAATGATDGRGAVALVAGYLTIWLLAAFVGAAAQTELSRTGLIAGDGSSLSSLLTASLLVVAGLYQFSVLKAACLARCRMPLTFFMERWRPGWPRAWRMGLDLGALCLGCCWALMALAFVGGTMNLWWMGAATLFMAIEKLPDLGRWLTRPAGWALILAGGAVLTRAAIGT